MNKYYRKVPAEKLEQLIRFRQEHPPRQMEIDGISWEYVSSGDPSAENVLLFPGGLNTAESAWRMISVLEKEKFHLICPSYPAQVETMDALANGAARILSQEGITRSAVVGGSYGGMVAQVFIRRHPSLASKLVLTHTYPPEIRQVRAVERFLPTLRYLPIFMVKRILRIQLAGILPKNPSPDLLVISAQIRETVDTKLTRQAAMSTYLRMIDYDQQTFLPTDLADWPGKTLIMLAEDDPTTPEELRNTLTALYPQARVHLFHGGGHASAILESSEYNDILIDFLREGE